METLQAISNIITTVGFPIAMCMMLYYQLLKSNEQHTQEMDKITEALNNNTNALNLLIEKILINIKLILIVIICEYIHIFLFKHI